jgi:hypothetical protein
VEPSLGLTPTLNASTNPKAATSLAERQQLSKMLKDQLARAQNKMKLQTDLHRSPRQFQVGEQVLLKLQSYTQTSVASRPCPKLALNCYGPYTVMERIGSAAYKLDLLAHSQVHRVFHVSQLMSFMPDHRPVFSKLPATPSLDVAKLVPERILDHRLTKRGNATVTQVPVKWNSLAEELATWEDYYVVRERFPLAPAWGQAKFQGGGSVTTDIV